MLDGETEPALLVSCIVPLNLLRLDTVTENEHVLRPMAQVFPGGALAAKSPTRTKTPVELEIMPLVPVTVTV